MIEQDRRLRWRFATLAAMAAAMLVMVLAPGRMARTVAGDEKGEEGEECEGNILIKGQCQADLLSAGGYAAQFGPKDGPDDAGPGNNNPTPGTHDNGRGGNTFVNDPCLDPPPFAAPPENLRRTVQSETEIAVLNTQGSMGKKIVVGYNDSWGFYDNRQGLSGYAYSTDGGNTWIDGGGLPPRVRSGAPAGTPGSDTYFGDPVVVVDNAERTFTVSGQPANQPAGIFYYASIYLNQAGGFSLSVNRGRFQVAPPQSVESISNTRCLAHPELYGVPNSPKTVQERVVWEPPVEAVTPVDPALNRGALIDKEWLYVDQKTGTLYLTYTRFAGAPTFETPIELVRSYDGGRTWTAPTVIVANEDFDFNQATQAYTTPTGRLIVTWNRRRFSDVAPFPETEGAIEYAVSDDDGATFGPEQLVALTNPQAEPPGYNRARTQILNAPYIIVDRGADGGATTQGSSRPDYGNIYITYFNGKTPFGVVPRLAAADILVSRSTDNGTTFGPPVKVNDDPGTTAHVFPSVQANKNGDVFVTWLDRRYDAFNRLTNAWANVSHDGGLTFGHDKVQTDVATTWFVRRDAAPNFGDYNSSELLGFNQFVITWADGRFPAQNALDPTLPAARRQATPDTIFTIANGLGVGNP